MKTAFYQKNPL